MTYRPKLYPNHSHQWAEDLRCTPMVRCTVCGFQAPRNAADLDGQMTESDGRESSASAAIEAVNAGLWDKYLQRLADAIVHRWQTDEYRRWQAEYRRALVTKVFENEPACATCGLTLGRHKPSCDQLPANPRLPQTVSTDNRCTHQNPAGQCLDRQGHPGDHQPREQET